MNTRYLRGGAAALALILLLSATGCVSVNLSTRPENVRGAGQVVTRSFAVGEFHEVEIHANVELIYQVAPTSAVEVEMYENLFAYLTVTERNGTLIVRSDREFTMGPNNQYAPKLYLSGPELTGIYSWGGLLLRQADTLQGDSLNLQFSGAADVELDMNVQQARITMSGAGALRLSGTAEEMALTMSGTGDINALELQTKTADVRISGVGHASISCSDSLEASISGVGNLEYRGNPQVGQEVSGAGAVTQIS